MKVFNNYASTTDKGSWGTLQLTCKGSAFEFNGRQGAVFSSYSAISDCQVSDSQRLPDEAPTSLWFYVYATYNGDIGEFKQSVKLVSKNVPKPALASWPYADLGEIEVKGTCNANPFLKGGGAGCQVISIGNSSKWKGFSAFPNVQPFMKGFVLPSMEKLAVDAQQAYDARTDEEKAAAAEANVAAFIASAGEEKKPEAENHFNYYQINSFVDNSTFYNDEVPIRVSQPLTDFDNGVACCYLEFWHQFQDPALGGKYGWAFVGVQVTSEEIFYPGKIYTRAVLFNLLTNTLQGQGVSQAAYKRVKNSRAGGIWEVRVFPLTDKPKVNEHSPILTRPFRRFSFPWQGPDPEVIADNSAEMFGAIGQVAKKGLGNNSDSTIHKGAMGKRLPTPKTAESTAIKSRMVLSKAETQGFNPQPDPPKEGVSTRVPMSKASTQGFNPQPDPPRDKATTRVPISKASTQGFNPQPDPPRDRATTQVPISKASTQGFNPQPDPPKDRAAAGSGTLNNQAAARAFNPQPDPPKANVSGATHQQVRADSNRKLKPAAMPSEAQKQFSGATLHVNGFSAEKSTISPFEKLKLSVDVQNHEGLTSSPGEKLKVTCKTTNGVCPFIEAEYPIGVALKPYGKTVKNIQLRSTLKPGIYSFKVAGVGSTQTPMQIRVTVTSGMQKPKAIQLKR